jgi:hypothetical protein
VAAKRRRISMKTVERMQHEMGMQQLDLAHLIVRLRDLGEKVSSRELLSSSAISSAFRARHPTGRAKLAFGVALERADEMTRRKTSRRTKR